MKHSLVLFLLVTYLMAGEEMFHRAYNQWDDSLYIEAERSFDDSTSKDLYWRNVVRFHRINYYLFGYEKDRNKKKAKELIDSSLNELEILHTKNSYGGEVPALLATIRGIGITINPLSAMVAGPKVQRDMNEAFAADSLNPRSLYLLGVSYYFMPSFIGGGFAKSREYLSRSVAAFEKEAAGDGVDPNWGYSTALAFMGEIHSKEKKYTEAKEWYQRALLINPEDQLAQLGLSKLSGDTE